MTSVATPREPRAAEPASVPPLTPAGSSASRLAIYGGSKAAPLPYRERFRQTRLRDVLPLLPYVLRGRNTLPRGGPIERFEERFARLAGTQYAILMNSGTATLHSAYVAVGVKPGDEVLVPSYTWFASATPILQCGAVPVFTDVDPRTLTLDPEDAEKRITSRTKAICVVHIWGNPAALDRFVDLARRFDLALVEDASHAHGAKYQGRPVGSWGDVGCFSLQGSKAVTGGEAGVAVTNNPYHYDRMLAFGCNLRGDDHVTGTLEVGDMALGVKHRPHLCAAIMANASLSRLGRLNQLRRRNYELLAEELATCPALETIDSYPDAERGGYLELILRYRPEEAGGWPREAFVQAARAEGVRIDVDRYTRASVTGQLLHQSPLFNSLDYSQFGGALSAVKFEQLPRDVSLPVSAGLTRQLLTMPPFTSVKEEFVRQQARALVKVVDAARSIRDLRCGA